MASFIPYRRTFKFLLIIFITILNYGLYADIILLDDNEILEGNIVSINEKEIIINTPKGELNVPKEIIKKYADTVDSEKQLREEIKQIERKEKFDKVKNEAKEKIKEEIQHQIETATKVHSPRLTMARSAIFPGWGQAEAGFVGGTALMVTSAASLGILAYAHNLSSNLQNSYEQTVLQNLAIVTLTPGTASVQDRLAASYLLNQGACDGCDRVNNQERDFQQLFGIFYVGQLTYLANTLGLFSAAPIAKRNETINFDFFVNQDRPIPHYAKQTSAIFSITLSF